MKIQEFNCPHLQIRIDDKPFDRLDCRGFNDFLETIKNLEESENCLFYGFNKLDNVYFPYRHNKTRMLEETLIKIRPSHIGNEINLYFQTLDRCSDCDLENAFTVGFNKYVKYSSKFMYKLAKEEHAKNIKYIIDFVRECQDIQKVNDALNTEFDTFEEADQFIKKLSRPALKAYNDCRKVHYEVLKFYINQKSS